MAWTDYKDDLLLREMLLFEPFKFKPRTKERGNAWKMVAENLNQLDSEKFKVDQRAVRERFGILKTHFETKTREELKASGIAPENDEIMNALEDILEKIKEYEKLHAEGESTQTEKNAQEVAAASDMRLQALETFSESKKRKEVADTDGETSERKCKKSRSSGSDTLNYLREKGEREQKFKKEELELKKQKYELLAAQQRATENQQQENMKLMREQMSLQQQQTQQMLMFMANVMQNKQ